MAVGLVMAIVTVAFIDVGVTMYAEGVIRTSSIVITVLGLLALFVA